AVWLITFSATALLDVDLGLLVGVVFALLTVIIRSQRPYSCILGQVPGTDIYKDISVYKVAEETPNIKIFRFDSALFFANSEFFKSSLYKLTVNPNDLKEKLKKLNKKKRKEEKEQLGLNIQIDPEDPKLTGGIKEEHNGNSQGVVVASSNMDTDGSSSSGTRDIHSLTDIQYIILDCSTMSYVDSMGVKVLKQVISELKAFNITVYLAQCKSSVREMFESTGFYNTGPRHYMFITIHDAVVSAQLNQWSILSVESESPDIVNGNNNATIDDSHKTDGVEDSSTGKELVSSGDSTASPNSTSTAPSSPTATQQKAGADLDDNGPDKTDMEKTEV
ncbi:sulfate transporter-like, partial [Elysia marginata]